MHPTAQKMFIAFLNRLFLNRYPLLVLFLFYKFLFEATTATRYGDFWEHAAAVHALITDTLSPSHPFFSIAAPHAFLSPYSLLVASYAALTRNSAISALETFGLVNFCLFAYALFAVLSSSWLKDTNASNKGHKNSCAFYSLILMLFLWGKNTWGYSGFLNFSLIADVLPYPSTFALGLSFLGLSLGLTRSARFSLFSSLLTYFLFFIVLLTHPLTSIFFATGLICQLCTVTAEQRRQKLLNGVIFGPLAICAATLWPYFSLVALISGAGVVYHPENRGMYVDVLSKIWPTLIALPLTAWAFKDKAGQSILLIILLLGCVYLYGGLTEKYSFGRVISIIIILLQILIAIGIARFEQAALCQMPTLVTFIPLVLFTTLIYLSLPWLTTTTTRALTVANSLRLSRPISTQQAYKDLIFLKTWVNDDSTVLSDLETSWIVPSIRGKVIGALHPQAFVADQRQRFDDVNLFFDKSATTTQQLMIAEKYQAQYLLLNKHTTTNYAELQQLFIENRVAKIIYDSDHYVLLRLPLPH